MAVHYTLPLWDWYSLSSLAKFLTLTYYTLPLWDWYYLTRTPSLISKLFIMITPYHYGIDTKYNCKNYRYTTNPKITPYQYGIDTESQSQFSAVFRTLNFRVSPYQYGIDTTCNLEIELLFCCFFSCFTLPIWDWYES